MKDIILLLFFVNISTAQNFTQSDANRLASLPLKCLQQEYPNKLSQVLINNSEIQSPKQLHPAFYGCFDWHSSVHGHWSLVYLLNRFPNLAHRETIIRQLTQNLSEANIQQEIIYMSKPHEKSFERTYGWVWLLKLQQELDLSSDDYGKKLSKNLQPLTNLIVARYVEFLPKLLYPIRVGTHSNTAFGLTFAWDYAIHSKNEVLKQSIQTNAMRLFFTDQNCPFTWEPSGTDFLSPCMEELGLMRRVMSSNEFLPWAKQFMPQLFDTQFNWEVAKVSDRQDGHLVHLDGLNFSRAWNMYELANYYPAQFSHLNMIANTHFKFSMPSVIDGNYEGEHWLASFALRALEVQK